ncbi:hypothetical protein TrVFT333_009511 [Trichoderma virens FT-333]|nr:hypothetical protein TrVFT333_009511 [Trichoderma virens FT-333]
MATEMDVDTETFEAREDPVKVKKNPSKAKGIPSNSYGPRRRILRKYPLKNLDGKILLEDVIYPLATKLKDEATALQTTFSELSKEVEKTNRKKSILACYRIILSTSPTLCRVEIGMQALLGSLENIFTTAKCNTPSELKGAIDKMSEVKSSVSDEDLNKTGETKANFTQHNASGATGYQNHFDGQGHHINAGGGTIVYNYNVLYGRGPETSDSAVDHGQIQQRRGQAHTLDSQSVNERISSPGGRPRGREDFQIAIICSLPLEYDVVSLLFDQFWDEDGLYGRARGDVNTYTTGRMGKYDVVLVLLPNMGTVAAAGAAASFRSSYPSLQLAFLVGICGGVPFDGENELHLGDVVISKSAVQYDLGSQYHKSFVIKDTVDDSLGRPNKNIRSLVKSFETDHVRDQLQQKACLFLKDLQKAAAKKRRRHNYQYPGITNDKLFIATYRHNHRGKQPCNVCDNQTDSFCDRAARVSCAELGCDESQLVSRMDLEMRDPTGQPEIFVGRIASGNMVMKSGEHRDKIAKEQNVIALEMEGAGVWDEIPCIIVKGVCDYADSHRNDLWQRYAAATAASVMKAVLGRYTMTDR